MGNEAEQRYTAAAHAAGCPRDQLENFISGGYVAQPKQLEFHAACRAADETGGPVQIGFGGARGPGKSHASFAQVVLDDCQRQPGLNALFLRSIKRAAKESFEKLIEKVCPHYLQFYKRTTGVLEIPVGDRTSTVVLGGYGTDKDIENYLGLEYDAICVEENTLIPEMRHKMLRGSLRTAKPGWRARLYSTTNPGGVGHGWYKRVFIEPWRKERETKTRFVFATHRDNRYLKSDYIDYLQSLTGWLGRAWRDGDWDIAAGQFFTTWRRDPHVITPHTRLAARKWWCAMDYGFVHPTVVYLFAEDGDGNVYTVDEHCERRWQVQRHAEAIKAMLKRNGLGSPTALDAFVASPDAFAQKTDEYTVADRYAEFGINLTPAKTDRISGAAECLARLGDVDNEPKPIVPTVFIYDRCAKLIECIPAMEHDPHRPEDVLKVDIDDDGNGGDDPYEAWRYGLMEARRKQYGPPGTVKYA